MWNESPVQVRCMIQDARGWCTGITGMTQRDDMGREVGGGFRMGNTCTPVADSCQCMAKPIQYCAVISLQLNKFIFKKKKKWGFNTWVGKILRRKKWQPTPVLLPRESHGRRSLVGYSPQGRKEWDMTEWFHFTSSHLEAHKATILQQKLIFKKKVSKKFTVKGRAVESRDCQLVQWMQPPAGAGVGLYLITET